MLQCRGLVKRFGNVLAINDFSISLPRGHVVSLLGPSGCGKTTALRMIAGFVTPDAGTIAIGGKDAFAPGQDIPPERRRVGLVFQEGALFPHLTVEQNIAYGLDRGQRRSERVNEVAALTGLAELKHRMPYQLSGGQQQRVALARALAPRPELLLMDEPFSNLDPGLREQVRREVMAILRGSGTTAVFVTHDQEEAMYVGDTIAVMNNGRIEQHGSPEEIFHQPRSKFVAGFIGMVDFVAARQQGNSMATVLGPLPLPQNDCPQGMVEAMVRPDCLECVPSPDGNGTIVDREFRGAFYVYRVQLVSGEVVRCLCSHNHEYPVDARVSVRVRNGHCLTPFVDGFAVSPK